MRNFLCCYHRWLITSLAIEKCKKKTIFFKLFWYKVFVHSKLKLLNFLVDSVLTFADVGGARMAQRCKHSPPTNMVQIQNLASMPYVGWVCCLFSPLLWEVLSPITNTSKFHLIWNTHTLVSAPWVNKWEFFFTKCLSVDQKTVLKDTTECLCINIWKILQKKNTTWKEQVLGLKFDEWNNIQIRTSSACQNWTGSYGKNVGMKLAKQWLLSKCEC